MTRKIDATRPFYAVVGAGDLAVEFARGYTADVQARFAKIELEPKALRDQARTVVTSRIDELTEDAKGARTTVEARAKEARERAEARAKEAREQVEARAKEARGTVESRAKEAREQIETYLNETVETYDELASRGRNLVARIRRQQATQDAKAAAKVTSTKAKTARTQTSKSAKQTAGTAKGAAKSTSASAKKTAGTARTNAKSTATAAKKTAKASTKAASDASDKVGN